MSNHYPYLVASLPMLHFGLKAPFSFEGFLGRCHGLIPDEDYSVLASLLDTDQVGLGLATRAIIKSWVAYDWGLRNALARLRASRKHIDPSKYLRVEAPFAQEFEHLALAAQRNPSPMEAKRMLDAARWKALDDLSFGHYFDLDTLIIYAYKLMILERWDRINTVDKDKILEEALKEKI